MAAPPIDPKLLGELAVVIIKAVSSQTSREQVGLPYTNVLTFPLPHLTVDVRFFHCGLIPYTEKPARSKQDR